MPQNDIYNNKSKYEKLLSDIDSFSLPPEQRVDKRAQKSFYYCKNHENLKYFNLLARKFDSMDLSYVRRLRILNTLKLICFSFENDLSLCSRDDIDCIVAFMHTRYTSPKSKSDFIRDIKYIWKILFPEKDIYGRNDETIVPYPVRHLSGKIDKSKEKSRQDKLTYHEFEMLLEYFSDNPKIQAFLALSVESLGRPQEILYTKIKDIEFYENYAKIHISEHGKEGIGFLQCIDSFPYLLKWFSIHPLKQNKEAFIFLNDNSGQLTPPVINNLLKTACNHLKINKPITCYSLKRNGVTFSRLRGESDLEIQHKARWTSTKQLKTYDLSSQEDSFKLALAKRGLIRDDSNKYLQITKSCRFCGFDKIGFSEAVCPRCFHIIDHDKIIQSMKAEQAIKDFMKPEQIQKLFKLIYKLQSEINELKESNEKMQN